MYFEDDFFKQEVRCGYTIKPEIKKIWAVELTLLQKFMEVCDKYNLHYYADAGTLLGAVRHRGFIPWDDDIDIVMFRNDYDKLSQIAPEEFETPFFWQTAYTDIDYPRGHAQLRNSNTTAILDTEKQYHYKFNQGIFIDIFVLDGVVDNKLLLKIEQKTINILKREIRTLCRDKSSFSAKDKLIYFILKILKVSSKDLFAKMEQCLRKYSVDEYEYAAPLGFIFETEKRIRNKHLYDDVVWLDFENLKVPVPAGYHEFLSKRYGNYMEPAQVPTTHGNILFDTEHPYTYYLNQEADENRQTS